MPESALEDKEKQDKGRADADALFASQVCIHEVCASLGYFPVLDIYVSIV